MHPELWPQLDWDDLAEHHGMERAAFDAYVPPTDAKSFDEWCDATQAYQAALLQLQIEDLRRCKGSPCGGFTLFCLADPSPAVGFGLLDHARAPKRAYAAVRDACRPVLPMVDPRTGNVHVVNDTRYAIVDAEVVVSVDGRLRRWRGDLDADAVVFIGSADLDDAIDVEVVLEHADTGRSRTATRWSSSRPDGPADAPNPIRDRRSETSGRVRLLARPGSAARASPRST